jgi:phospholipid/cholesterol/gamma-HCH transport system substrate-binding protein
LAAEAGKAEHGGVSAGGVIAVLGLLAIAILAAVVLLGDDEGHEYKLLFDTGGQLVPGNEVLVGGHPIGTIDDITLTENAQAEVEVTLDQPLHEGTTAVIRSTSLSGIANRYVAIHPGPNSEPEIAEGETLTSDLTSAPVDLDQFFNTFDRPTRAALQDFIQGQAAVYTGNTEGARRTYRYFAPGLQSTQRLLAELTRDQAVFSQFLGQGSRALGAVAERRDDLSALTENANRALGAIASRNAEFDRALVALPPALRQANTTFVNLRAALDDLDPLIQATGEATPELAPFLRDIQEVVDPSIPVVRDLRLLVNRSGSRNDLSDALRELPGAERAARRSVEPTITGLDAAQPTIEDTVPYTPDLLATISKLGQVTGYYDIDGHYARAIPAGSNIFGYNEATEVLEPIPESAQFNGMDTGPFTRCPGGATQPNVGFPAVEDHPFLGGGGATDLTGICDPGDVPPGP